MPILLKDEPLPYGSIWPFPYFNPWKVKKKKSMRPDVGIKSCPKVAKIVFT